MRWWTVLAAAGVGGLTYLGINLCREVATALGGTPTGDRLRRMQSSPRWHDHGFVNSQPAPPPNPDVDQWDALSRSLRDRAATKPTGPIPVVRHLGPQGRVEGAPVVTWYGHASCLVELDGIRLLMDPVWSDRCSPSQLIGPKRLHPTPVALADLGPIDAVVISHDHYDHLDEATCAILGEITTCRFVVPLGIGAHLEAWGIEPGRITELDWDESVVVGTVALTCVEAQHFSGRWLSSRNTTLWSSWVVKGPSGCVYFSGDTGYYDDFAGFAARYGPFDIALLAIGAYDQTWRYVHLDPEEAVAAALEMGSPLVMPIHWATFVLAPHPWAEPVEWLVSAAAPAGVKVVIPRPGEPVEVAHPPDLEPWWRPLAIAPTPKRRPLVG